MKSFNSELFLRLCVPTKAETVPSFSSVGTSACRLSFSLWTILWSSCRYSSSVTIWLSNYLILLFFFFCAWSGRSIASAVTKTTSWNVAALSYSQGRILVGHDFKCMQRKSVSFFLFPVSVFNHPSSLFYIFKKKIKYINITCKCCKFCSPTREKAVNCSSRHSSKLIKLLYNDLLALCLLGGFG